MVDIVYVRIAAIKRLKKIKNKGGYIWIIIVQNVVKA